MKTLVLVIAVSLLVVTSLPSAMAQDVPTNEVLETVKKELVEAIDKEVKAGGDHPGDLLISIQKFADQIRMVPATSIDDRDLLDWRPEFQNAALAEPLRHAFSRFDGMLVAEVKRITQSQQTKKRIRGMLLRALESEDAGEIRSLLGEMKELDDSRELHSLQDARWISKNMYKAIRIFEPLARYHEAMAQQKIDLAAEQTRLLGPYDCIFLYEDEWDSAVSKLQRKAGVLSAAEYHRKIDVIMGELLDDKNQGRLKEILDSITNEKLKITKFRSSAELGFTWRWQRMEEFAKSMLENVQLVSAGGHPQFMVEKWTRFESSYPPLMTKSEMAGLAKAYRVRITGDEGKVKEARLYYDAEELRGMLSQLLAELTDDAKQDRLDEIMDKIRGFRQFCSNHSSSSDIHPYSQRFLQLEQFCRNFITAVKQVKNGEVARINIDEWLHSSSEQAFPLKRDELTSLLKNYRVKVPRYDGGMAEELLYQSTEDVLARVKTVDDLARELPLLTKLARVSYSQEAHMNLSAVLPELANLTEIHGNLRQPDSFTMAPVRSNSYSDWKQTAYSEPVHSAPLRDLLLSLRAEAESGVIQRFFPGKKWAKDVDRNASLTALLREMQAANDYEGILKLARIAHYFQPAKQLVPPQELQALQQYLDGIWQMDELEQPRLAVMHFQRAAATQTTILPLSELKSRLQKLKMAHPEEYEKGTDDSLSVNSADVNAAALQALVVPAAPVRE